MGEKTNRTYIGLLLAGYFFVMLWLLGWPFKLTGAMIMLACVWEMSAALNKKGVRVWRPMSVIFLILLLITYYFFGDPAYIIAFTACFMAMAGAYVFLREPNFSAVMYSMFPAVYPGMLFFTVLLMIDFPTHGMARSALALAFPVTFMNDITAYVVGSLYGKTKLNPRLSPKKSVEGALGGLAGCLVMGALIMLISYYICNFRAIAWYHYIIVALISGVAGQVGDLTASMLKREYGIKDFSSILPGHGGFMDRLDGILFASSVVYIYFVAIILR